MSSPDRLLSESDVMSDDAQQKDNDMKLEMARSLTQSLEDAADQCGGLKEIKERTSFQKNQINVNAVPQPLSISELEVAKEKVAEAKMGLGNFDAAIVNFLVDDNEQSMAVGQAEKRFKAPVNKPPKRNNYEYIFQNKIRSENDADIFNKTLHDDTDFDLCKTMY